jgi:SAM-dependent methyltransferase
MENMLLSVKVTKEEMHSEVTRIRSKPIRGRIRLLARWTKFALNSLKKGRFDFFRNAIDAQLLLICFTLKDILLRRKNVTCNICGWSGVSFYPNVCAGYYDKKVLCPGCDCLDRYRTYVAILKKETSFFSTDTFVIEVAPVRRFQEFCLRNKNNRNYISFDICRYAMEKGDITKMCYEDEIADYFLCSDVLDYVKDDAAAFREVWRVLKPGGLFIIRVGIDFNSEKTHEYYEPNPGDKDALHIRRYGKEFFKKISSFGFEVYKLSVEECLEEHEIKKFGLCREPLFVAKKAVQHQQKQD